MHSIRTSCLFHFTKELGALKSILGTGIIPNFCREDMCYEGKDFVLGIPMVSFCDIPLTRTLDFQTRYGGFAIGLTKEWAIRNSINPILYVNDLRILVSLGFFNAYKRSQIAEVEKRGGSDSGITVYLNSPESMEGLRSFINWNNANSAINCLYGYIKKYNSSGRDGEMQDNYIENEWRYVVAGDGIEWMWDAQSYKEWRGTGKKPAPTGALNNNRLLFDVSDISYLITEEDSQVPDLVDYIASLKSVGGCAQALSDNDKKILLTKIISQQRIRSDF